MKINNQFLKKLVAVSLLLVILQIVLWLGKKYDSAINVYFFITLLVLSVSNLIIRNFTWSKPILQSPLNVFSSKYNKRFIVDLPIEIAYGKFEEVLQDSNFKIVKRDEFKKEIYARSAFNWLSGGENMYLQFEKKDNQTVLDFSSVSPRMYDFYHNPGNVQTVLRNFEDSLTI